MKKFNGIYESTYQTIFGKVQIYFNEPHQGYMFKKLDEPKIHCACLSSHKILDQMCFQTFDDAYSQLLTLSNTAKEDIKKLLEEVET